MKSFLPTAIVCFGLLWFAALDRFVSSPTVSQKDIPWPSYQDLRKVEVKDFPAFAASAAESAASSLVYDAKGALLPADALVVTSDQVKLLRLTEGAIARKRVVTTTKPPPCHAKPGATVDERLTCLEAWRDFVEAPSTETIVVDSHDLPDGADGWLLYSPVFVP